ncbi:hydrogenase 4 subunit B [Skermanella mucosa]|uniref:hydrogenase 4 subunit B n=1 Tax=Skermanella mucosa TaxID=1789672 RepID=UPI001E4A9705|nr:hydrogenase 4 subunit B [Skermanella mucosa]UEM22540.1 hydrogenase 4 subunit B [Skermanella mucosa]
MAFISLCIAAMLLLGIVGAARSWLSRAHEVVHGGMALVCAAAALAVLLRLAAGGTDVDVLALPVGLPWLRANLRLDALSAVFLLAVNLGGCLAAVFGWSYARHEAEPGRVLPFFPLFLAGMNLVLVADDAFVFLMAWEFMSLSSWLLVLASHREEDTRRAAYVYLVMASFGTACLLLAFGILAGEAGSYGFEAIRAHPLGAVPASFAALLVLLGAGSKAGLVPLHVWLPLAHPAAPSHISALMSGVMTKVAIYGLIRVLFDLVGEPLWWWGAVLAVVGAVTAVVGVLYALMQDDVKKLLAYSTVENIGVIVIGLGLALVFKASGVPALAALAMTAAMLHVLNHALFKCILFFGAGAVLTATGERDLDRLGGLIHRMPATALFCLVGAAAISALPPLNGFVAEWMLFQAVLNGPLLEQWELKIGFAVIGALLALSAALAAACFVRFYGIAFLGRARSPRAEQAWEVDAVMLSAIAVPAVLCAVIGVLPKLAIAMIEPANRLTTGEGMFDAGGHGGWVWLAPASAFGNSYSGFMMFMTILILTILAVFMIHRYASNRVRRSIPWACGFTDPAPLGQYSASSFAQPLRRVFGVQIFGARETVDMPAPGETRPARFALEMRDPAWDRLFTPMVRLVGWVADRIDGLQFLTIRQYLSLMFFALVVLLVMVAVSQ